MATYSLTGPDGGQYEIDAPDEHAAVAALSGLGGLPAPPPPAGGPALAAQQAAKPAYSGSILPFSKDASGKVSFDSNAGLLGLARGIVGSAVSAATLPGDVYTGKTDPMSDEAIGRATELASFASPVNPGIRAGDRLIPGALKAERPGVVPVPDADALYAASSAGYDKARSMGVDYSADAVAKAAGGIRSSLEADGILGELAPKSFGLLSKLEAPPAGSVAPLAGLEAARRALGHAARDYANPTEQLAAKRITEGLDRFVTEPDAAAVVAGPAAEAARVLKDARGNYAAAKRSDKLSGIEESAELRAAAANSGQNLDNTIRQRVRSILDNPKQVAGFSAEERDALESVVRGTATTNTVRAVGNLLGGGGGLGAAISGSIGGAAGGAAGGPVGMMIGAGTPLVGLLAKKIANSATSGRLGGVDEMVRMRSPLYEGLLAQGVPMVPTDPWMKRAVGRGLLAYPGNQ